MNNKVIIITGASVGIGAELARALSRKGAKVALAARNVEKLQAVADSCSEAIAIPTDVTNPADCQQLIEKTVNHFGKLDMLVNNAAVSMSTLFEQIDDISIFETAMRINFLGSVYCTHAALPHLKKTQGLIVAITSLAGKTGVPARSAYAASKHALHGFFDSLRIELMGTNAGIDITLIAPGFVKSKVGEERTPGIDGKPRTTRADEKDAMTTEECVALIIQAMEKRQREMLMGWKGKLLNIGRLIVPGIVDKMAWKSVQKEI